MPRQSDPTATEHFNRRSAGGFRARAVHVRALVLLFALVASCASGPGDGGALGTDSQGVRRYCGDGRCNGNETCSSCPTDCNACGTSQPDLVVTDISWSPTNPTAGQAITFSATIRNQGAAATPDGVIHGVSFQVDGVTASWSDTSTAGLASGTSRIVTANFGPAGRATWTATSGNHAVLAWVDDINRIAESDENNNQFTEPLSVGDMSGGTPPSPCSLYIQPDGSDLSVTGTGSTAISVDVDNPTQGRLYSPGQTVTLVFTTNASAADTLSYEICNHRDQRVSNGTFAVPSGLSTRRITWTPSASGYFAVKSLMTNSRQFPAQIGSRPQGISTFGVLPDTARYAGFTTPTVTAPDQYRFGAQGTNALQSGVCCSGDVLQPLYGLLGIKWVNVGRRWSEMEPAYSGQYQPITNPSLVQPTEHSRAGLNPYYIVDSIPGWENTSGAASAHYPPLSFDLYQTYMTHVGQESAAYRTALWPTLQHNYYQVTWEPEMGTGNAWLGTDAQFTEMYRRAYVGIHAGDPNSVVMGVTYGGLMNNVFPSMGIPHFASIGLTQYLDGLSTHGYWYGWTPPESYPPGTGGSNTPVPMTMRSVRSLMVQYLRPGAKLFQTELGIGMPQYYAANYPNFVDIQKQSAWFVRGHIIELGEGADTSFLFYTADFPGENGFGMFFNLALSTQPFGSGQISPKPDAIAVATLTRLIEGTFSLGYLNNVSFDGVAPGVLGYAFQSRSSAQVVTALWAWGGGAGASAPFNGSATYDLQVGAAGTSGTVTVVDYMGNATTVPYSNGLVHLTLSEYPEYVISHDVAAIRSHITAPQGYVP